MTTQSRWWIASYAVFEDAHAAKEALHVIDGTKNYQVRKGRDKNHKETFRVVERFQSNDAEVLNGSRSILRTRKGPGKRRARKLYPPIL